LQLARSVSIFLSVLYVVFGFSYSVTPFLTPVALLHIFFPLFPQFHYFHLLIFRQRQIVVRLFFCLTTFTPWRFGGALFLFSPPRKFARYLGILLLRTTIAILSSLFFFAPHWLSVFFS